LSSLLWSRTSGDVSPVGAAVVIAPPELDAYTAPRLRAELAGRDPTRRTVVDFAAVTLCGAAGIHVLLEANARHERHGGSLRVRNAGASIRRMFALTDTTSLLDDGHLRDHRGEAPRPAAPVGPTGSRRGHPGEARSHSLR
jgi:anti-anti-sigma factor